LVYGLDARPDRFALRYEAPSTCASLLHEGSVDLGLIPSIEYLARPDYHLVDDIAIASRGPVQSVALFTTRPLQKVETIAVDSSSRTSVALLKILCARRFDIAPSFVTHPPDPTAMLQQAEAVLLIGDAALFLDTDEAGVHKIDLGHEWTAMTGLPFVWAFWAGLPGVVDPEDAAALREARARGLEAIDEIAREYTGGDEAKAAQGAAYLRENIAFTLGEAESAGLETFFRLATEFRLVPNARELQYY
jgi:chorismate dehydratase